MNYDKKWNELLAEAIANGAHVITPNGLPITCIRGDAVLEHEHADHPSYLFPVVSTCPDGSKEDQALIYTDGCIAVTVHEYCYNMWYIDTGMCIGLSEGSKLTKESITNIEDYAHHGFKKEVEAVTRQELNDVLARATMTHRRAAFARDEFTGDDVASKEYGDLCDAVEVSYFNMDAAINALMAYDDAENGQTSK